LDASAGVMDRRRIPAHLIPQRRNVLFPKIRRS
jgi:hypothetical protein